MIKCLYTIRHDTADFAVKVQNSFDISVWKSKLNLLFKIVLDFCGMPERETMAFRRLRQSRRLRLLFRGKAFVPRARIINIVYRLATSEALSANRLVWV